MYKLSLTTLILISLKSFGQDNPDKYYGYHYVAGSIMGGGVGLIHKSPKIAFISSVTTGVGIGLGKEIYDVKFYKHKFSTKDFVFTVIGSITSGIIVYGIKKYTTRKKVCKTILKKHV